MSDDKLEIEMRAVGENLRIIRTELGLSMRAAAKLLGVEHKAVFKHEKHGFAKPKWARYIPIYQAHPDLRTSVHPALDLCMGDFINRSKLYQDLMSIYGRDNLVDELNARTNTEIIAELRERVRAWEWTEADIDVMRRRADTEIR